jgi:ABC-type sugar transport system permease subunit
MQITNWIMIAIAFISLMLTIVVPLVAYFNSSATKNRHLLSEHKTHVAENYATKNDVKDLGDRMERQMTQGFNNLKELLNNNIKENS